jgi:hypothetical protein
VKSLLAAALVTGALAVTAPPSSAGGTGRFYGSCQFSAIDDRPVAPTTYEGVLHVAMVTSDDSVPPLPAAATVTCTLRVNRVEQVEDRLTVTSAGVEAGARRITYTAATEDRVDICTSVHYLDLAGATDDGFCTVRIDGPLLPESVLDALGAVSAAVDCVTYAPDPVVCPLLAAHPGT